MFEEKKAYTDADRFDSGLARSRDPSNFKT